MLKYYYPQATFSLVKNLLLLAVFSLYFMLISCQNSSVLQEEDSVNKENEDDFNLQDDKNNKEGQPTSTTEDSLQTQQTTDIWQRIQNGLAMDLNKTNRQIKTKLDWYKHNQSYFDKMSIRAAPYLYHIIEETEARGLPLEIALMPIVESDFDPFAYSHAGASGLWQIMPSTGQHFGLELTWWYDGRRDIVAATKMALNYMLSLYKRFNNWELALAAYNSGPGRVYRALQKNIKKGESTDLWSLDLPKETKNYVQKLIAIGKVIKNPELYGIKLPPIPNKPSFESVDIKGQLDMAKAAKLADLSLEELYKLNPGLNRWSTPPQGPYYLAIPVNKAEAFKSRLTELPSHKRIQWQRYTIKSGDNLNNLAKKFHSRIDLISAANNLNSNIIVIGQSLLIPIPAKNMEDYNLTINQRELSRQNQTISGRQKYTYIVKPGDSFWSISKKYNVDIRQLARWNNISPRNLLRINQQLSVWVQYPNKNKVVRKVRYHVRSGDSLALIADKFNLDINEIKDWNILNNKYIHPGQKLTLFVDVARAYD
ncbi:MAG: LysM peptidoglycan-binding domain-containing protein [Candidatus Endonucleobacter bathymodioli]|uniref:LysM peptidoglycan-binding domain-containing protein n=1 Tax=Candidatus Endonucleibacter bathymodioli TaxID=539814 RepID=A0AA90NMW6_9GAMM|nr:LysM peptidoglycan-binding domain-containing protein [Candidatus Endonucleobacter bathymodioli]